MPKSDLGIYFLDVGQGDCTFVVPPDGEGDPILFDCADDFVAKRFCEDHGITDLEAVVASHLDIDHVRGMLPFLRDHFAAGRSVRQFAIGIDRPIEDGGETLKLLLSQALDWEKAPPCVGFSLVPVSRHAAGPVILAQGGDWRVQLVLPWYSDVQRSLIGRGDANLCSAVLRVERAGTAVLVGADAPLGSWERLEPLLRPASVFRTPHHGGEIRAHGQSWRTFEDLHDAVGAGTAVISVGTNNGHGHPFSAHLDAAKRTGACRIACTQMTSQCHQNPQQLEDHGVELAKAVGWPWRHRGKPGAPRRPSRHEVPCASSVMVSLSADGSLDVVPSAASHGNMVARASTPLCL